MARLLIALVLAFGIAASRGLYNEAAADYMDTAEPSVRPRPPPLRRLPPQRAPASAAPTDAELALFELTNKDRAQAGLPALAFDADLLALARARGADQRAGDQLTTGTRAVNLRSSNCFLIAR